MASDETTRAAEIARSREDAGTLGDIRIVNIIPSRRDFRLYAATQKQSLAVVAVLDPQAACDDLVAQARRGDDAEVAALALATLGADLPAATLHAIDSSVGAPLLRLDPLVAANQIYDSRRRGFDAVLLAASELTTDELLELAAVASSLHVAPLIEWRQGVDPSRALAVPHAVVAVTAAVLADGLPDLGNRTVVLLDEPGSRDEARRYLGIVDAIAIGGLLWSADDVGALVQSLQ